MTGRVVLVTGGSSGLGAAAAAELARRGHRVYAASRRAVGAGDHPPIPLPMDVRDAASVREAVATVVDREGRLDALVNNAGVGLAGAVEDTGDDEAAAIFDTNVLGAHRIARAVLPVMRRQRRGLIVNVGSMAGEVAIPFQGFYSATKAALGSLSHALRLEAAPHGVEVTLLQPGDFRTPFTDHRTWTAASRAGSVYEDVCRRAIETMERDEREGSDPAVFARTVADLVEGARPRPSYDVGTPIERLAMHAARLVPWSVREWILRARYGV